MVIWFCGLSASGKSTLAWALLGILKRRNPATLLIDGDDLRKLVPDIGYYPSERTKMAGIKLGLVSLVALQGIDVIVTGVSAPVEKPKGCFEVYLDIPIDELRRRDPRRLYASDAKDILGLDLSYREPTNPNLTINLADQQKGVAHCLRLIMLALEVEYR